MIYQFRESVRSYLNDRMISAGVDLLSDKSSKLAPDLRWNEMPGYYDAWLAAQRVKADWAMSLLELWEATWASNVPDGWTPSEPDEQVIESSYSNPHPQTCWDESWLARLFTRGAERLWLYADMTDNIFRIGFALEDRRGRSVFTGNVPGIDFDREDEIFWQAERPAFAKDGSLDLAQTLEICRGVRTLIESC